MKDNVAISRRRQTPKREEFLSAKVIARLEELLRQHLLPPVNRPVLDETRPKRSALEKALDDLAAGKPDPRFERERKKQEIKRRIERCFVLRGSDEDGLEIPDQVLEFQTQHSVGYNDALIVLLATDLELEPDTREYISRELQRLYYPAPKVGREGRKGREFAMCIRNCKELLREAGLKPLKEDRT